MKVLALAHRYLPACGAGAETMLHAMLRELVRRGHEVDVSLSRQYGEPYTLDGVRVWPHVSKKDPFRWLRDCDVIVSHLENSPRAAFLGHWNNKPVALIHHNTMEVTHEVLTTAGARVDLVVANSKWMAGELAAWLRQRGARQPRTIVVRPLVDPDEYRADGPHDHVTLVNLQRLTRSDGGVLTGKGAEVFWQLAERMPKIKFLGVKGAYGDQLVRDDLPNVDVVDHVPHHELAQRVLARTRVLLMPSAYESWGRIATEAMAAGIPVIAHPTPGLEENLGGAGIFVDRDDLDGWRRALQTLAMPGPYKAARRRALQRSEELRPDEDLARWCDEVERAVERGLLASV